MSQPEDDVDPDWDTQIAMTTTPSSIIHALFWSADAVHTGWESCIEHDLVIWDMTAVDDGNDNHCRLVEQEYADEDERDLTWHDWTVELKLANVYISAHWRAQGGGNLSGWDWCAKEAEEAYTRACVLVGKRVRRGLVVESEPQTPRAPRTHH